jgi:hypothetical protein
MANYISKRGANVAPSYATTGDLPASTEVGDLVFVGGQLGIAVSASGYQTCDKTDIRSYPILATTNAITAGGFSPFSSPNHLNLIFIINVTSEGAPTYNTNNLTAPSFLAEGLSSATDGYSFGGKSANANGNLHTDADKLTFSSSAVASLGGSINNGFRDPSGASMEEANGYIHGGYAESSVYLNKVQKYAFATTNSATTVPFTLAATTYLGTGGQSATHGYHGFGEKDGYETTPNTIDKYAFSNNAYTSGTASLSTSRHNLGNKSTGWGSNSTSNYYCGSDTASGNISKYTHASGGVASSAGALNFNTKYSEMIASSSKFYIMFGQDVNPRGHPKKYDTIAYASDTIANAVGQYPSSGSGRDSEYGAASMAH